MSETFSFTDPIRNQPWMARLVCEGDEYGLYLNLRHDEDRPMIEFYDADYADHPGFINNNGGYRWGQFVSRYYLSTFLEEITSGLDLDGGIPKWKLSAESVEMVKRWLDSIGPIE